MVKYGNFVVDQFMVWKMAAIKMLMSAFVAMMIAFCGTQVVASQLDWDQMWWMKKWQFWLMIVTIGLKDMLTFMDQTVSSLQKQIEDEDKKQAGQPSI